MPEHHTDADEDVYFGEDYYDEFHDDSDEEEIMDDPYAEAERLGRLKAKEKANKRNQYMNKGRSSPFKINNGQLDAQNSSGPKRNFESPFLSPSSEAFPQAQDNQVQIPPDSKPFSDQSLSNSMNEQSDQMFAENQNERDPKQEEKDLEWEEYREHPQPVQIP